MKSRFARTLEAFPSRTLDVIFFGLGGFFLLNAASAFPSLEWMAFFLGLFVVCCFGLIFRWGAFVPSIFATFILTWFIPPFMPTLNSFDIIVEIVVRAVASIAIVILGENIAIAIRRGSKRRTETPAPHNSHG